MPRSSHVAESSLRSLIHKKSRRRPFMLYSVFLVCLIINFKGMNVLNFQYSFIYCPEHSYVFQHDYKNTSPSRTIERRRGKQARKMLACMYLFEYFELSGWLTKGGKCSQILHITCMDYVHIHALLRTLIPVCTVV